MKSSHATRLTWGCKMTFSLPPSLPLSLSKNVYITTFIYRVNKNTQNETSIKHCNKQTVDTNPNRITAMVINKHLPVNIVVNSSMFGVFVLHQTFAGAIVLSFI